MKHSVQDIAVGGGKETYRDIDLIIIAFNSQLVRNMAKSLGGDYQEAILQICEGLDESPDMFFGKLEPSLQEVIRSHASK